MHLTGKIFAFFTLCLAVVAVIFTAKTIDRQNEWNQRIEKARQDYQQAIAKVPPAELQVKKLEDELTLQRLDWGRQWSDVQVSARNLSQGQITIGIGRNNGLARSTEAGEQYPLLHAFQPTGDGQMKYVGEFRVTQIDPTQAALQLSRTPREGETNNWDTNTLWRFRDALPASQRAQIGDLLLEMTLIEQRMKDSLLNLTTQQKSVQAAQELLNQRLKELNGDPAAPEILGDEYRLGLVEAIRQAEAKRDDSLAQVQRLREELHGLHQKFEQLLTTNQQLERELSGTTQAAQPTADNTRN